MSTSLSTFLSVERTSFSRLAVCSRQYHTKRWQSSTSFIPQGGAERSLDLAATPTTQITSPLTRLPTWHLMRNMILSFFLTQPILLKPGLAVMQRVANSKWSILNPDKNPLLKAVIKPVLYNHFCAGTNASEIRSTIAHAKRLGFTGIVLVYNGEVQPDEAARSSEAAQVAEIEKWRDDTLSTVSMIEEGNWIGMKLTGAGQAVTEAFKNGHEPPAAFTEALNTICDQVKAKGSRMWIDAEHSSLQKGIDKVAISLMRQYNTGNNLLVYNTMQAYLKESRQKLKYQMGLAQKEGWKYAVKLVRGAYMAVDDRTLIHDTKADTDTSYNSIVRDLLSGSYEGFSGANFPRMELFLAGHNTETVRMALKFGKELASRGELKINPAFGQLQGMADDVGGEIINFAETTQAHQNTVREKEGSGQVFYPTAYKCLHWGSIRVSMQYLVRRAVENAAAVDRMKETAVQSRKELWRRMVPSFVRG